MPEFPDHRTFRVLLVDDSPIFLDSAANLLTMSPELEIVGRAMSGYDALDQVAALNPDLVLMDLAMPGMSGLEATRRIKAQPHPPRIVIVTLHDDPDYRAVAEAVGADGFIAKSEFGSEFALLIQDLFSRPLSSDGAESKPERNSL